MEEGPVGRCSGRCSRDPWTDDVLLGGRPGARLYIRAGMRPWWPLLYVDIPAGALGGPEPGLEVDAADVERRRAGHWPGPASIGRSTSRSTRRCRRPRGSSSATAGRSRPWAGLGASGACRRSLARPRVAGPGRRPGARHLAVLRAAAAGGRALWRPCPGRTRRARVLERGARIVDRDTFCATDRGLVDPVQRAAEPELPLGTRGRPTPGPRWRRAPAS